ncbi:MAG: hypothetical protein EOO10_05870 [Chitinophagaceae bacterium]|nr:MAG: hypothetical protein EOO10_05870 [Chitinophagaceae bacterium]
MVTYKVNNTFLVIPDKNVINNVRLEPRIMKLLLYMMENRGKVISREEIINTVWEGYPGGDEGMNQAVSYLRKALNDWDRTLIETIPKTGYVFHATVEPILAVENSGQKLADEHSLKSSERPKKNFSYLYYCLLLIVVVLIIFWILGKPSASLAPAAPGNDAGLPTPQQAPKAP